MSQFYANKVTTTKIIAHARTHKDNTTYLSKRTAKGTKENKRGSLKHLFY